MSFNSYGGILFVALVLVVYHLIRGRRSQNVFLLAASFYFYATSSLIFTSLLLGTIYIGYTSGLLIQSRREQGYRSPIHLVFAISMLLIVLGIFKYYDFFAESFAESLKLFGFDATVSTLSIILPVGISFYIFQTIGYIVDVARGDVDAERDPLDFALFVSFFPQLVAGPIERSGNLLKQVKVDRPAVTANDVSYGTFLIAQGYAKKVVIADNLAPYVNTIFQHDNLSAPLIIVGLLLFAIQIYGDFSGYTDIARGYSRLLGFRILLNFDRPYIATSPSNFWRRWHISLSNWFTEYVYFSLGGNRSKSQARRSGNVMATMTLSGLWHGASANFIIWGAYHGALILVGRVVQKVLPKGLTASAFGKYLGIFVTFWLMVYGWMYFRITDFEQIMNFHWLLVNRWDGWAPALAFLGQGMLFLVLWIILDSMELFWLKVRDHEVRVRWGISAYIALMGAAVFLLHAEDPSSFIYFRF